MEWALKRTQIETVKERSGRTYLKYLKLMPHIWDPVCSMCAD